MSMGLGSAKLGAGPPKPNLRVSRQHKVAPSIAEQAIFIPKPHKRVSFKVATGPDVGGGVVNPWKPLGSTNAPGAAVGTHGKAQPIPLPGSGAGDVQGTHIKAGQYGINGLSARFNSQAWQGGGNSAGGQVQMQIDYTPSKQHHVIATQEEGRQVNHEEIHFTQQYDSYGRPRIGFSREPYDFAATKYVSVTSQLTFQQNMAKTQEQFDRYMQVDASAKPEFDPASVVMGAKGETKPEAAVMGAEKATPKEVPIFGNTSDVEKPGHEAKKASDADFMGKDLKTEFSKDAKVSAEESLKQQEVKVVDVFKGSKSSEGHSVKDAEIGLGGAGEQKQKVDLKV